jgi:hypothetical protein
VPPSPPAEKTAARKDQAGQASSGDGISSVFKDSVLRPHPMKQSWGCASLVRPFYDGLKAARAGLCAGTCLIRQNEVALRLEPRLPA